MTTDTTRAPAPTPAERTVSELRLAWLRIQTAIRLINDHQVSALLSERTAAIETLKAAQSLIHGVGESIGREIARAALKDAS
jgi:hypothetical protein